MLVLSIAFTLPLDIKFGNIAIIIAFVSSLFFFRKRHLFVFRSYAVLYPFIFFLVVIASSLYSKDITAGFSRLDRHLLPLLLTVIMIVLNKAPLNRVLNYFSFIITCTTLFLSLKVIYGLIYGTKLNQLVFHEYTASFGQHPVYYALMLLIALLFLFSKIVNKSYSYKVNWLRLAQIIILILGLIFCASKAVIFIFIFLLLLGLAIYVKGKKSLLLALTFLGIFILCIFKFEYLKNRFLEGTSVNYKILEFKPSNDFTLKKQFSFEEKQEITDLELRILMGKITLYHMCLDGAMGFGYGSGDAQDYLDYYLFSYNLGPNWYQGYNVHNQYLHLLLNYGIVVLSLFLVYLFMLFRYAFKAKDYLHMAILIAFCFVFLFEVSLIRNKGIVLFYFFNLLFLTNNTQFENSYFRNTRNT